MPLTTNYTCEVCGASINDSDLLANPDLRRIKINGMWASKVVTPPDIDGAPQDDVVENTVIGSNDATAPDLFCSYACVIEWFNRQTY